MIVVMVTFGAMQMKQKNLLIKSEVRFNGGEQKYRLKLRAKSKRGITSETKSHFLSCVFDF